MTQSKLRFQSFEEYLSYDDGTDYLYELFNGELIEAPPLLIIEVVSPGELKRDRDYIAKRMQYQDCGIPEYWIVDPQLEAVLVLQLAETIYIEVGTFSGSDRIHSPQFTDMNLTAGDIFLAGNSIEFK